MPGVATRNVLFVGGWLAVVIGGHLALVDYSSEPGPASGISTSWPAASGLELDTAGSTLVVFAHPRCPCTLAVPAPAQAFTNSHASWREYRERPHKSCFSCLPTSARTGHVPISRSTRSRSRESRLTATVTVTSQPGSERSRQGPARETRSLELKLLPPGDHLYRADALLRRIARRKVELIHPAVPRSATPGS